MKRLERSDKIVFKKMVTIYAIGSRGVELAKVENQDIVLVDMGLPDMDGFKFIGSI